jgi:two-component system chemotaxis response regulator CheB
MAPSGAGPYRVMLVDDSAVIRGLLARALKEEPTIEVTASVGDGAAAVERAKRGDIEVVVLDIEMPRMDGIEALPKLLEIDKDLQVVMASTLTQRNAEISLKALALGAKDYLPKPSSSREMIGPADFNGELIARIKGFGQQRRRRRSEPLPSRTPQAKTDAIKPAIARPEPVAVNLRPAIGSTVPEVIAIGSSTGGPQALFEVLKTMGPSLRQPVFITQHMPATFTKILAEHIKTRTGWNAAEAIDGEAVVGGRVYVAPGNFHMVIKTKDGGKRVYLTEDPPENFCRPSVDPMLRSLVDAYRGRITVAILTGMGHDGREGCRGVVAAGGQVIAQDEASSVVWGMPGAVANAGLCSAVLPLGEIGAKLRSIATTGR